MFSTIPFNGALLQRYGVTGPRYTSYPTATRFHEQFTESDFRNAIEESNGDSVPCPLSLYVHLPYCSSPCFYCACTRIITRHKDPAGNYLDYLRCELTLLSHLFERDRVVDQVHFGGGTPTFFNCDQLGWLLRQISAHFNVRAGDIPELSIEIDPRTVNPDDIRKLAFTGFNRMSYGIQDFDPEVQRAVNRVQSRKMTLELIAAARDCGVRSINVDLIYGLPRQTPDRFARTLDAVIESQPDRIADYGYAHMPHLFPAQRRLQPEELPDTDTRIEMFRQTITRLTGAGYVYIGMDHFALPTDDLAVAWRQGWLNRNFQGYSARPECDLVGLGMSAVSMIAGCYSQNYKTLSQYYDSMQRGAMPVWRGISLTDDDHIRRDVIQAIMCQGSVRFDAIANRYRIDFFAYFHRELQRLEQLEAEDLVVLDGNGLRVTPMGRLLLRVIAMVFDAYLVPTGEPRTRFSRLI